MRSLALAIAIACASVLTLAAQGAAPFTQAESDAFVRKIIQIEQIGGVPGTSPSSGPSSGGATTARTRPNPMQRLTAIAERELNSYFRYDMRDSFPAGVTEPTITMLGDGHVTATAVVDLDAVRNAQQS